MSEYKSQKELYLALVPALNVKIRKLKKMGYYYIKKEDIWNYLKEYKWSKSINLGISEMVSDIFLVDEQILDSYLKEKMKYENKEIILE